MKNKFHPKQGGATFFLAGDASSADAAERTIEVAFLSDKPIENWFGTQTVDLSGVDLSRVENGTCSVLWNHDRDQWLGLVHSVTRGDGVLRAKLRFGESPKAQQVYADMASGLLRGISCACKVPQGGARLLSQGKNGDEHWLITRCELLEISPVSVPADASVGVGRALHPGGFMEDEIQTTETQAAQPSPVVVNVHTSAFAPSAEPQTVERAAPTAQSKPAAPSGPEYTQEEAEIRRIAEADGSDEVRRMATNALISRQRADEFRRAVIAHRDAQVKSVPAPPPPLSRPSGVQFSRGYQASFPTGHTQEQKNQIAELAGAFFADNIQRAFAGKNQAPPLRRSIFDDVPKIFDRFEIKRAGHGTDDDAAGAWMIPTQIKDMIVDLTMFYGVIPGLAEYVTMESPKVNHGVDSENWLANNVSEGGQYTEYKLNDKTVELNAQKMGVAVRASFEFLKDISSTGMLGQRILEKITSALAFRQDQAGFFGTGLAAENNMVGIVTKLTGLSATVGNIAGLRVASGASWDNITRADIAAVQRLLPAYVSQRYRNNIGWICSTNFWRGVLQELALSAAGATGSEVVSAFENPSNLPGMAVGRYLGWPVFASEVFPSNSAASTVPLLFGALRASTSYGEYEAASTRMYIADPTDEVVWHAPWRGDIVTHTVGNASATASERRPGPVVGLIMAAS